MRTYLKNIRTHSKLSQNDIAKKLGVTRQYYSLIESGDRQKKMDIELIQKLSVVFNVSVEYIIEQETALKQSA